jgi:hypothetical protein
MEPSNLHNLTWRKSSYSNKINCVEVARMQAAVAVRDSKDPDGPALLVSPAAFEHFLRSLR